MSKPMTVVLAADSAFTKQLSVVLAGITKHATREHQIFIFHDGFDAALRNVISASAGEAVEVCWRDARSEKWRDALIPEHLSSAALFRLRIAELLPREIERIVYLDTDTVVARSLDELWGLDLHGSVLGAVRDAFIPWAAAPWGLPWTEIGVAPDMPYFNSGLLVIDTNAWRSQCIGERTLELMREHRFQNGDQCALNAVLAGNWCPIAPQWNLQTTYLIDSMSLAWVVESRSALTAALDDPAIVHFTPSPLLKPWDVGCTHPYRDLWFEYLDRTPWADWRPVPPTPPSWQRKVLRRLRKAGRTLIHG